MSVIHLMHPDPYLGEFLFRYLQLKGHEASWSESNVDAFYALNKTATDLLVMSKDSPYLDAPGFFIKKRSSERAAEVPVFMVGDFSPQEVQKYKQYDVKAFLSRKVNPVALCDRINQFLHLPQPAPERRTPMLVDLHAKESTLFVQIEGNLEPDKLLILNYRIRLFLKDRKCTVPRILIIIPSLYPDNVNAENIRRLFAFMAYKELKVDAEKVAVLTRNKTFLEVLDGLPEFNLIKRVESYYEGFQAVSADFDTTSKIPVEFMKVGNRYYLDLFDLKGKLRLKAQTPVCQALLDALAGEGMKQLMYYGRNKLDIVPESLTVEDQPVVEVPRLSGALAGETGEAPDLGDIQVFEDAEEAFNLMDTSVMDYITREFMPVSAELFEENVLNEKQNLFFAAVRGQPLLFISLDRLLFGLVQSALSVYFAIDNVQANQNIRPILQSKAYSIVFVDLAIPHDIVLRILQAIRSQADRSKTTIILMGKMVNKTELMAYKRYGTDHMILQPYTSEKFFNKVYQAVTADRGL